MTAKRQISANRTDDERQVWARFDAEIQKGIDDAHAGRLKDADEVFDRLEAKYRAMSQPRG